jgi:hypothetical protein
MHPAWVIIAVSDALPRTPLRLFCLLVPDLSSIPVRSMPIAHPVALSSFALMCEAAPIDVPATIFIRETVCTARGIHVDATMPHVKSWDFFATAATFKLHDQTPRIHGQTDSSLPRLPWRRRRQFRHLAFIVEVIRATLSKLFLCPEYQEKAVATWKATAGQKAHLLWSKGRVRQTRVFGRSYLSGRGDCKLSSSS